MLLGFLGVCAIATVIGVLTLWPDFGAVKDLRSQAAYAAPGVKFVTATVVEVQPTCTTPGDVEDNCGNAIATLAGTDGQAVTVQLPPGVADSGLGHGDKVQLSVIPDAAASGQNGAYAFDHVIRSWPLAWLAIAFVVVVAAVARLRGILALVSLAIAGGVFVWFVFPSLLSGHSGLGIALTGSSAVMFVVLYVSHGLSMRTSTALAGTLLGIGITATTGWIAVHSAILTGYTDETSDLLAAFAGKVDFQGVLICALVIAGLGVINDITITQASAVWELREAGPGLSRLQLFRSAMRIGRDHIASTIYTLVFAYAGSGLTLLLLVYLYSRPFGDLVSSEIFSEEIVVVLAGAIGLVLAVPVTTAIAASTVVGPVAAGGRLPNSDD